LTNFQAGLTKPGEVGYSTNAVLLVLGVQSSIKSY